MKNPKKISYYAVFLNFVDFFTKKQAEALPLSPLFSLLQLHQFQQYFFCSISQSISKFIGSYKSRFFSCFNKFWQ